MSLKLTPAQAALIRECLLMAIEAGSGDAMVQLCTGSPKGDVENIRTEVARVPDNVSGSCTFTFRQLHSLYASITHAVVALPSEEDFHIRTGFYRENAIALANCISAAVRDFRSEP
ncbi:hypothetical protein ACI2L4_15000 [Streptomyces sparsogenes]|uniref:hypothetical protein n=1 Tax=Streptomyces sparsogenes TaxID=67365 RepID=UPI0033D33EAC